MMLIYRLQWLCVIIDSTIHFMQILRGFLFDKYDILGNTHSGKCILSENFSAFPNTMGPIVWVNMPMITNGNR